MRKMYIVSSDKSDELEQELTTEQFNSIWWTDSRHYKKERAIQEAQRLTNKFNKRFDTNYEWEHLFCIDEEYFDSDGFRV